MRYNTAAPYFPEEDIQEIADKIIDILRGNGMLTMGEYVAKFEKKFADYIGCSYAIATNSCTSALEICLNAIGVNEADEVIVPVQTFFATGSSIATCGATPVFCEIDENFLICFEDLKKKITLKTKAVIIVHFAGLIHQDIFEIRDYLKERNIYLIEDAAHAHGARINGIQAGNIGDFGCYSFYSTKIITTGEGGMITTNNLEFYEKCNSLRNRGLDVNAPNEIFNNIGSNRRFTELQAILGLYQLKRLELFVEHRNRLAEIYKKKLNLLHAAGKIKFQVVSDNIRHSYWRFVVFLSENIDRELVKQKMANNGIKIDSPYYPLLHLQPIFKKIYNSKEGLLPYAEKLTKQHICLPIHLKIELQDAEFIATSLEEAING